MVLCYLWYQEYRNHLQLACISLYNSEDFSANKSSANWFPGCFTLPGNPTTKSNHIFHLQWLFLSCDRKLLKGFKIWHCLQCTYRPATAKVKMMISQITYLHNENYSENCWQYVEVPSCANNQGGVKRMLCLWCLSKLSACHWKKRPSVYICSYLWGQGKERKREISSPLPMMLSWSNVLPHFLQRGQLCENCFFKPTPLLPHYLCFSH